MKSISISWLSLDFKKMNNADFRRMVDTKEILQRDKGGGGDSKVRFNLKEIEKMDREISKKHEKKTVASGGKNTDGTHSGAKPWARKESIFGNDERYRDR